MNILVVGNVLKDVYLNLDNRTSKFEVDKNETKWLNVSFDASSNHYFHRNSSYGGAAISLEILEKLGLNATISGSDLKISNGEISTQPSETDIYRYILISDSSVSYLTPSNFKTSQFDPPAEAYDYLYIDRSANLDEKTILKINTYLDLAAKTKLVLYLNEQNFFDLRALLPKANLIILEENRGISEETYALELNKIDPKKIIKISETSFSYLDINENVAANRIDIATHLSFYSIAAATILGCFILGRSVEDSLKIARANTENSRLDATRSLSDLEEIVANSEPENDLGLVAANLMFDGKKVLDLEETDETYNLSEDSTLEDSYNGVILPDNNRGQIELLSAKRIIPGIKVSQEFEKFPNSLETYPKGLDNLSARLKNYYNAGFRFAKWQAVFEIKKSSSGKIITPTAHAIEENCRLMAEYAKKCQQSGFVPIIEPKIDRNGYYSTSDAAEVLTLILDHLFSDLKEREVDFNTCILKINKIAAGENYPDQPSDEEIDEKTNKTIKDHVPDSLAGIILV